MRVLLLAAVACATARSSNVAIVGSLFGGGYPIDSLQQKLSTKWDIVPQENATAADVAAASAFVETPMGMLAHASAGRLYQFAFTGVPQSTVAAIPPRFTVSNCHQSSVPIAEYVLAAALEWTVQLRTMDARLRECTWRTAPPGNDCTASHAHFTHKQLSNATIGILGYGHIGEAIATRAAAFGTRVIATTVDPPKKPPAPLAWIGDDSANPRLFSESDFIVVCVPLLNSTLGLVGPELLSRMSSSAVLINIARGPIVQEKALYEALHSRAIGGAVLDVWWNSMFSLPPGGVGPKSWPSAYRFDELPNVIMSGHTSGSTLGSQLESVIEVAANLDSLALGRPLKNVLRNGTKA